MLSAKDLEDIRKIVREEIEVEKEPSLQDFSSD
jgi:hypothetical protein